MLPLLADAQQITSQQTWLLLAVLGMGLAYFTIIRPMKRKKKDPLDRAPAFASLSQQRSTERQMQNLLVELSEMSRQISAQLDTRAARLELLIREADAKIAALRSAPGGSPPPPTEQTPVNFAPAAPQEEPPDPRHADVYALADSGRDPAQIASELNRPRGEIELILALRGGRGM